MVIAFWVFIVLALLWMLSKPKIRKKHSIFSIILAAFIFGIMAAIFVLIAYVAIIAFLIIIVLLTLLFVIGWFFGVKRKIVIKRYKKK